MSITDRPILCLDFDGVIHRYSRGWQDGSIYDGIVEGFWPWAMHAKEHFRLVVYSSRSRDPAGTLAMARWLMERYQEWGGIGGSGLIGSPPILTLRDNDGDEITFEFASEKPPAWLTIDDRAIQFRGDWGAAWLDPVTLRKFKPWNQGEALA